MKPLYPFSVLLLSSLSVLAFGCAAQTEEIDDQGGAETVGAPTSNALVRVVGAAEEKKQADYGTTERLFGTARADDRMKAEMLPRVRAAAAESLRVACDKVTAGAGHLDGSPFDELVRAERIFSVTEFIVQVSNTQNCLVAKSTLEARIPALLQMMETADLWQARAGLAAAGEPAAKPTIDAIAAFITPDGKLDMSKEAAHGGANWTFNHVLRLVDLVKDLKTPNPAARVVLTKLRAAFDGDSGAASARDQIDRTLAALPH